MPLLTRDKTIARNTRYDEGGLTPSETRSLQIDTLAYVWKQITLETSSRFNSHACNYLEAGAA